MISKETKIMLKDYFDDVGLMVGEAIQKGQGEASLIAALKSGAKLTIKGLALQPWWYKYVAKNIMASSSVDDFAQKHIRLSRQTVNRMQKETTEYVCTIIKLANKA